MLYNCSAVQAVGSLSYCTDFVRIFHHLFFLNLFLIYFYQLGANYFTVLQWFLPYIDRNQPWIYMCSSSRSPLPPPSPSHPSGSSQCTSPEHLSHAFNLGWRSVSHWIIYIFQYYSLRSSHPCLLPQSPSFHLCPVLSTLCVLRVPVE